MFRILGNVDSEHVFTAGQDAPAGEPVEIEGFGALCNDCGAVIGCDSDAEQLRLHEGAAPCPNCGSVEVCAGACCVRR